MIQAGQWARAMINHITVISPTKVPQTEGLNKLYVPNAVNRGVGNRVSILYQSMKLFKR